MDKNIKTLLIVVAAAVAVYFLYNYVTTGSVPNVGELTKYSKEEEEEEEEVQHTKTTGSQQTTGKHHAGSDAAPAHGDVKETFGGCHQRDQLSPDELMPKDNNNAWTDVNPDTLKGMNFLNAGWNVGIDSVGQTNRNPNLQLRSEPANPQIAHSIFLNTTIEPDTHRRPFELGGCN